MPLPPALEAPARLEALRDTGLLDALPEAAFDRLTRLAARLLGTPVALLSLVEHDRQVFASAVGLPEPWATTRETPLSHSYCQHVVGAGAPFVVEDAHAHPLVRDNGATTEIGVAAYAGVPVSTPDGHVLGSFCAIDVRPRAWTDDDLEVLRDLAALAMTEIALRKNVRDHRLLTEYASDMISTHAPDGVYRYASPAARTLLGYEPADLVGRQAYDLFHPDDIPSIEANHAAALADESRAFTTRYRIRRADGTYRWVETRGQSTPGGAESHEIVAVTRDVARQQAAEEALREERERLRTLTEAIPQLVWTALPDGSLDYVSDRVAAYFGESHETVLGSGWVQVLHPDDVAATVERWTRALETGEPYETEFRLRDADGVYHWHLARALPLRSADGEVTRWFGTNTDITDRKDLEAALETEKARLESLLASLRRAQAQLVQQEKLAGLGRVTAGIAHEIKNPLNFVVNFGELAVGLAEEIREGLADAPAETVEALDDLLVNARRIVHHGQRADRIARSMLALARREQPDLAPADLNALVARHVALAVDERADGGGPAVALEAAYDDAVGEVVLDAEGTGRAVVNLVTNALDALADRVGAEGDGFRPVLRVATRRTVGAVELLVEDNGGGIPAEVAPHVFEPFYTTKAPGQGVGLGLALTHETVVRTHGGELTVRTREGEGTLFTATFPTTPDDRTRSATVTVPANAEAAERVA